MDFESRFLFVSKIHHQYHHHLSHFHPPHDYHQHHLHPYVLFEAVEGAKYSASKSHDYETLNISQEA